jgi:hypothetical protein
MKLLVVEVFNSQSDHIFHSQPNGYHTLFVSQSAHTIVYVNFFFFDFVLLPRDVYLREKIIVLSLPVQWDRNRDI